MSYTVLARKYRSQSFDDVVGQAIGSVLAHPEPAHVRGRGIRVAIVVADHQALGIAIKIEPEIICI